ncbi:hypothetical protein [Methylobacter marinus]|uniref:hypothetical protein n=1 Tax=Methylobacter marinus TaxID=34058 RepID=UPI000363C3D3|nr:hypothetical protein [Methylobacter marinus]
MTDYPDLYRRLAREILAHEGRIDGDARQFVARLVDQLRAEGRRITPAVQAELADYLTAMQAGIQTGIVNAVSLAATAGPRSLQSAAVARLAEQAFNERWPDGLTLSDRLWHWQESVRTGLTQILTDSIRHGESVNKILYKMQRAIERAPGGRPFQIVETYADDWVKELYESAVAMIHDPDARELWKAAIGEAEERILSLKPTGTRSAAERVLSQIQTAVSKGADDLADRAVKWWLYDKQLYHLKRIARTEMATAMHRAVIAGTENDETIIGYQWRLSASHPAVDICDYYANIDMGLGRGVWSKEAVPKHKAHPHCMCLLIPRVTRIKQPGSENYAAFIKKLPKHKRDELLPAWAQDALKNGAEIDQLIRPDGLGLRKQSEIENNAI